MNNRSIHCIICLLGLLIELGLGPFSCDSKDNTLSGLHEPQQPPNVSQLRQQVVLALVSASKWLAAFPSDHLRYDACLGLSSMQPLVTLPWLIVAREKACRVADLDHDNPMQRLYKPAYRAQPGAVKQWVAPTGGNQRVNVNWPVTEALYCDLYGLRPDCLAYIVGPMSDKGGYHSTHALWALILARKNACLSTEAFFSLSNRLRCELLLAQPIALAHPTTSELDLFAERSLMLMLWGPTPQAASWIQSLVTHQTNAGSWSASSELSYRAYHATLLSAWALAVWLHHDPSHSQFHPGACPSTPARSQ